MSSRVIHSSDTIQILSLGRTSSPTIVRRIVPDLPYTPCALSRYLMRHKFVVWDTETTGLEDDSKLVSIGAVDQDGKVLLDTLINPGVPIPADASAIHGVTDDALTNAPTFAQVYPEIRAALEGKIWVIYNKAYDVPRLNYECERHYKARIQPAQQRWTNNTHHLSNLSKPQTVCMMEAFATHYGDWSDYWESYKWQSLSTAAHYYKIDVGNAHNALADAITTLHLIRHMALDEDKSGETS